MSLRDSSILTQIGEGLSKAAIYVGIALGSVAGMLSYERIITRKKITRAYALAFSIMGLSVGALAGMVSKRFGGGDLTTYIVVSGAAMFSKEILTSIKAKGFRRICVTIASKDWRKIILLLTEDKEEKK